MKNLTFSLFIFYSILVGSLVYASDYQIYLEKYGRPPTGGDHHGIGMDLSDIFQDDPEYKKMKGRAHEIDRVTQSIRNSTQVIELQNQAIGRLKGLVRRRNQVREQVKHMDHSQIRTGYLNMSTEALRASRDYYVKDEFESGMIAANIAETALDLATTWTPGVSWGRDIYEAILGIDMLTGRTLSAFDRGVAVLGAATVGVGSKVGKTAKVLNRMMKGSNKAEALDIAGKLVKYSGKATKAVADMKTFFKSKFGKVLKKYSMKTSKRVQGQSVYKVTSKKLDNKFIKPKDQYYLDNSHKDHLEFFDKKGKFKHVLNLDGSFNIKKTLKAGKEGRKI